MPKMFNLFSQEEHGNSRSYDGNGLGLALVKKLCEMNRVTLQVTSAKGLGTTFRLKFPVED